MNQLIHETSPYLLQHAHNPVDWHAWKPEVFEKARREDKPLIVSIGYSTCHWCHVMERESFEDPDVAAFMNEHFICIKVDREERPDVDQIYMEVCQVIQQNGGWPLNAFLLPDGRPFYAGTYYPPLQGYGRPSWMQLLHHLYHTWRDKRETIETQAESLMEVLKKSETKTIRRLDVGEKKETGGWEEFPMKIFEKMQRSFDLMEGGFGSAPKFPGSMNLEFLLHFGNLYDQPEALKHVLFSIEKMAFGGIYDQIGGGFSRYATDPAWLVPHFEKMLYDNALLVGLMADTYKWSKKEFLKETIEETLEWVDREMGHPGGGFYAALDADSEGEEGKFYVWEKEEIEAVLGPESELFNAFYGVSDQGNWEGKNILNRKESAEQFSKRTKIDTNEFKKKLEDWKSKLSQKRAGRIRPGLDDKILLDWNSLMIAAFAKAYKAVGKAEYKSTAKKNLDFILDHFSKKDGPGFFHTWKNGQAKYDAFLDDYAFLIAALLEVYEITFETEYLKKAKSLTEFVLQNFHDPEENQFFFTSATQEKLVVRRKNIYDSATPSGNSIMLQNLQKLALIFENPEWQKIADQMMDGIRRAVVAYPTSFAGWARAILTRLHPIKEIAVVGESAFEWAEAINQYYFPNALVMASLKDDPEFPLLQNRWMEGETVIYVCENYACKAPYRSLEAFLKNEIKPDSSNPNN